ncbi:hypothetical protein INT45_003605 [Circinella minor]|uniref:Uncharacterized protein n=1 Tax=Circinella minor TaxID=1195481 RepID=A0A8H7RW73_9FUNG|nr:hypothetical protein INT45_003605 [Circinella minor]
MINLAVVYILFAVPTAPFSNSKAFSTIQKQASTTCAETRLVQGLADEESYLEPELSSKLVQCFSNQPDNILQTFAANLRPGNMGRYSTKQPNWRCVLENLLNKKHSHGGDDVDNGSAKEAEEENSESVEEAEGENVENLEEAEDPGEAGAGSTSSSKNKNSSSSSSSSNSSSNATPAVAPSSSVTTATTTITTIGLLKKRSRSIDAESSKSDSMQLPLGTMEDIEKVYGDMEDEKKWCIEKDEEGKDVFLEDIMFSVLSKKTFEHILHSFIIRPSDPICKEFLTQKQINIIKTAPELPTLPESIKQIFDCCEAAIKNIEDKEHNSKEVINKLWKAITSFGFFDQEKQFDESWVQATILNFLNMCRYDTLKDIQINGSEMDYVTRCWSNFDRCFENIGVPGRDRTCQATLVRVNKNRCITGEKSIDQQQRSVRPDFLLIKGGVEFAVGECGKEDLGGVGKKEIVERGLHVPKIMKDLFVRALSKGRTKISFAEKLKIVVINENGNRLQVCVLDSPKGYVCRLFESNEYEIPTSASLSCARLFPMKIVLKTKGLQLSHI